MVLVSQRSITTVVVFPITTVVVFPVSQPGDCFAREVTESKVEALRWKCSLQKMPAHFIKEMVSRIDGRVIEGIVKQYKVRDVVVPKPRPKRFILERDCDVDHRKEAVEDFFSWLQEKYGELEIARIRDTGGKLGYGRFVNYARSHLELRRRCDFQSDGYMHSKDKGYMKLLRMYMRAIKMCTAEGPVFADSEGASETAVAVFSGDPHIRHIPKRPRLGSLYQSARRGLTQNWKRRRLTGGGRPRLAAHVREGLFMWYSIIRHSVNVKIMCRFPKLAFKAKARMLYEEYVIICLHRGVQPETVYMTDHWVDDWLIEHRLTQRQPNRKWKLSRPTLKERLKFCSDHDI